MFRSRGPLRLTNDGLSTQFEQGNIHKTRRYPSKSTYQGTEGNGMKPLGCIQGQAADNQDCSLDIDAHIAHDKKCESGYIQPYTTHEVVPAANTVNIITRRRSVRSCTRKRSYDSSRFVYRLIRDAGRARNDGLIQSGPSYIDIVFKN